MKKNDLMINNILKFWFFECTEKDWFKKDLKFDRLIQKKFLKMVIIAYPASWKSVILLYFKKIKLYILFPQKAIKRKLIMIEKIS